MARICFSSDWKTDTGFFNAREEVRNMSPEIRINGQLITSVPDETGVHQTLAGKPCTSTLMV